MSFRFRIFTAIFISMGIGVLFSHFINQNSNTSFILIALILFIVAAITSAIFTNFVYKNISNLETLTSQIAKGRTKKKFIKALKEDSSEFGNVAHSISEISEDLKKKFHLGHVSF